MKHVKEDFPFSQNDDFMVLSLPYKDENVAFTVVLPKKRWVKKLPYFQYVTALNGVWTGFSKVNFLPIFCLPLTKLNTWIIRAAAGLGGRVGRWITTAGGFDLRMSHFVCIF